LQNLTIYLYDLILETQREIDDGASPKHKMFEKSLQNIFASSQLILFIFEYFNELFFIKT